MKKITALMLALVLLLCLFAACDKGGEASEGTGTGEPEGTDTAEATVGGDEIEYLDDFYPYNGEVIPPSIASYGWGAPDGESVYFPVSPENVIHDGKGTWNNMTDRLPTCVFDGDVWTSYDCDEEDTTPNNADMNVGIPYDGEQPFPTGYVGAYFEDGITLTAIRWHGRAENPDRNAGGVFQASVDGKEWVDLYTIEQDSSCRDYENIHASDLPESCTTTVYHYVRYVSPQNGFCNITEIEFWGKPAK